MKTATAEPQPTHLLLILKHHHKADTHRVHVVIDPITALKPRSIPMLTDDPSLRESALKRSREGLHTEGGWVPKYVQLRLILN